MVMLLDLPEEALCLIAEELPFQGDRCSLIRSCRRLYTVLLPALYSRVILGNCTHHTIGQASRLVNAIARRPQLANAVRSIRLGYWDTEDANEEVDVDYEYDRELLDGFVAGTCWSKQPHEQLRLGNTDAWLALLLPQLKGLRRISICYPDMSEYVTGMFVKAAREDTTAFSRLVEAFGEWYDTENSIHASLMDPFFKFPAMRRVGGHAIVDNAREEEETRIIPFSDVTDIDLDMTNTECGFRVWIESCKALKTFRLNIGGGMISDGPEIVSAPLQESISLHKTTLEGFWLCGESYEPPEDDEGWMGSFADFSMLKYLHISISMLAKLDEDFEPTQELMAILPPSLETLYLCHCHNELLGWAVDQIDRLIESNCLPRLTSLGLEGYGPSEVQQSSLETMRKLEELHKKCADAGVFFATSIGSHRVVPSHFVSLWPCAYDC